MKAFPVPAWLKHTIEDELRKYPATRAMIQEARQDIIDGTPDKDLHSPKGDGTGDPPDPF